MNRRWVMMRRPPPSPKAGLRSTPTMRPPTPALARSTNLSEPIRGVGAAPIPTHRWRRSGPMRRGWWRRTRWAPLMAPRSPIARFSRPRRKNPVDRRRARCSHRAPLCRSGGADRGQAPRHLFDALTARRQARLGHHVRLGFERHPRRICRARRPRRGRTDRPRLSRPHQGLRKARSAARNPG